MRSTQHSDIELKNKTDRKHTHTHTHTHILWNVCCWVQTAQYLWMMLTGCCYC